MMLSTRTFWILLSSFLALLSNIVVVSAFTSPLLTLSHDSTKRATAGADQRFKIIRTSPSLLASPSSNDNSNSNNDDDIFLGIKNFFSKLTEDNNNNNNNNKLGEDDNEDDDDDELPAGTILLLKINATQLKPGGLRLFLMFYLLGMQNTPDKNTWRADQKLMSTPTQNYSTIDNDDDNEKKKTPTSYVLEMLYDIDRTGMLQIEIIQSASNDDDGNQSSGGEIRLYRCGSRPSTSYLMQESVIVDGVLEELQQIAGLIINNNNNDEKNAPIATSTTTISQNEDDDDDDDDDEEEPPKPIADEDRLLIPDPLNAIEIARESLAFG
jgi:hypothetical protein